ncbi:AraC family transcriptional regulator [Nocardioides sp. WV_118_6]|uniref:helix-turn-helix transcriptional regulator n=1 Tax=Nocardioides simplex TaxID=2045 RepID=UPI00214F811C|nr:AraC family transcriptional regulator [Pimelobacter simplex]UUW90701.1 AraC family transcriptional regulator [Pimelobacter simplex]UUW94530.1 AraC family transcriptional regulator [Pimelobacter simplex]
MDDILPNEHLAVTGLDEWSQLCSTAYVPLKVSATRDFRGALRERERGPLSLSQVSATPSTVQRTSRLVTTDPREALLFAVFVRGRGVISQHGHEDPVRSGSGYVLQSDQPYGLRLHSDNEILILRTPAELTGLAPAVLPTIAGRVLPPGTAELEVLTREVATALLGEQPAPGPELLLDLLRAVTHRTLYGDRSRPYLSGPALWASARWYLERHHSNPRLNLDDVAARFMVSRRHLEQQFVRHGAGPAAYLRNVRRERAAHLLLADRSTTVARVARSAGFADVDTFIRAFRRHHGQTPAEWRRHQPMTPSGNARATRQPSRTPAMLSDLRRWTRPADAPFLAPPGHEKRSTPTSEPWRGTTPAGPGHAMKGDGPGARCSR